ncbi:putative membrane protein YdaK [Bacillus velezensis]|nr:putative membrane protein YdaK [Bacillus velezensis]
MKISFNESQKLCSYTAVMLVLLSFFIYYASQQSAGLLITCITLLVTGAGIWFGAIYALVITLLVLFVLGSLLLWFQTGGFMASAGAESLQVLVIWGIALLLFSYIAGRIHELAKGLERSVKQLREEITSFVAVDRVTGFDNHLRMKLELSEEIKRAERYGNSFVFCCCTCIISRNSNPSTEKKRPTACWHLSAAKSGQAFGKQTKNSGRPPNGSASC